MHREPSAGGSTATLTAVRTGATGLLDDLKSARHELLSTRHAAYHRLLGVLLGCISGPELDQTLVASFERVWKTRSFPSFYERPLLILAALRADALQEGTTHPLHAALAADHPDPDVVTAENVMGAFRRDRLGVWSMLTTRRVQTNDTTRAVAWLWPAFLAGCDGFARPLSLVDIGAGAGLNLIADQLPTIWSDLATGKSIPCASRLNVLTRLGFDARPLNMDSVDDVLWLRACIWPGETERLARFEESVQAMRAAMSRPTGPVLERSTASLVPDRLDALLARTSVNTLLLAYQTIVAGYLEPTERELYRNGMLGLLQRHPQGRVLWVELELDDARRRLPSILIAHVRSGDTIRSLRLGRSSQHPTKIEVDTAGVAELTRYMASRR